MTEKRMLDSSNIFKPGDVPIVVTNMENHGKTRLHSHNFYEVVYIDSGFSLHTCNGIIKILTSGDMFAMKPGDNHSYNSTHNTRLYNCLFRKEAIEWMEEELAKLTGVDRLFNNGSLPWKKINLGLAERHEAVIMLERMRWEGLTRSPGWQINMKSLLASFIVFYARLYGREYQDHAQPDTAYLKYIFKLLEYIENNYTNEIDTDDMAGVVGLSPDYLARQFKGVLGLSPAEYVRNYRIAKAMELLKKTGTSINDISESLGFASMSLFSRQFKSIIGITPTEFRNGHE